MNDKHEYDNNDQVESESSVAKDSEMECVECKNVDNNIHSAKNEENVSQMDTVSHDESEDIEDTKNHVTIPVKWDESETFDDKSKIESSTHTPDVDICAQCNTNCESRTEAKSVSERQLSVSSKPIVISPENMSEIRKCIVRLEWLQTKDKVASESVERSSQKVKNINTIDVKEKYMSKLGLSPRQSQRFHVNFESSDLKKLTM